MTLDDFKDVYKDKTPLEKLRLLLVQTDIIRGDARNQESAKWRCNDEEAAYWRNEIHAMEERIQWLYDQLAPLLKAQEPVSIEERLVLDKLHTIQDYARVNEIHWMADGAAFAENVMNMLRGEINQFRKAQEPRVMKVTEVIACEVGTVLWVEERQGVTWNLFPLEIDVSSTHPDTGTNYLFFITYHDIRKFECSEYNQTWRCWTQHPTNEQREATPWE